MVADWPEDGRRDVGDEFWRRLAYGIDVDGESMPDWKRACAHLVTGNVLSASTRSDASYGGGGRSGELTSGDRSTS